jgi:hypothetical protein
MLAYTGPAGLDICSSLIMPHSQRTFTSFWGSKTAGIMFPNSNQYSTPSQPDILKTFLGALAPCPY